MGAKELRKRWRPGDPPPSLEETKRQVRRAGLGALLFSPLMFGASFLLPPSHPLAVGILRMSAGGLLGSGLWYLIATEKMAKKQIRAFETYNANWLFKHAPTDRKWAGLIFPDKPD